jgi:hypothetical protein
MRKIGTIGWTLGLAIFCVFVGMSSVALAEDAKPATPALNVDELKKALGLSIYLQGGYTYNADAGTPPGADSEQNDLRVFDHKANSFTLDLVEIVFQKDPDLGGAGFKVKLSAGETAKWIHSRGLSGEPLDQPQTGDGTTPFDLTEAYISYNAAIGKGLRFDAGKFGTFIGAEVMEALDDPNYSRSFLFNYAEPLTHTGVKMGYAFTDAVSAALFFVNGWDNSTDNNRGKSYGASVTFAPAEIFSIIVNGITGPEQDESAAPTQGAHNNRALLDVVATIKPIKNLSLILNTDNGSEQNAVVLPSGAVTSATWSGISGIVKYDFNDMYSLAVRGETFGDKDGARTGTIQRVKEITVTTDIRMKNGIVIRPEYRHDSSTAQVFDYFNDAPTKNQQNTVALAVMYRW